MHTRVAQIFMYSCKPIQDTNLKSRNPHSTQIFVVLYNMFMFSFTHFQGSWMAQEKVRKAVGGYRSVRGEAVCILYCSCSRQQPAGTSALVLYRRITSAVHASGCARRDGAGRNGNRLRYSSDITTRTHSTIKVAS